jgi:hypothetical protein
VKPIPSGDPLTKLVMPESYQPSTTMRENFEYGKLLREG